MSKLSVVTTAGTFVSNASEDALALATTVHTNGSVAFVGDERTTVIFSAHIVAIIQEDSP